MWDKQLTLDVGAVDDESWIWLNDEFLGEVTQKTHPENYYRAKRIYKLKREQLSVDGENTLVIRVGDWFEKGGIMGTPKLSVESLCLDSYYIQKAIADDDPYRYYRW
jgi:beta-galactosidase